MPPLPSFLLWGLALLLAVILLLLAWGIWTYNRLVRARNQQQEAWAGIDVQLRKRYDLVPALVEAVRGYSTHEKNVLTDVTEARRQALTSQTPTDVTEQNLSLGLRSLFALAENYPDLKADANFLRLSQELVEIEDHLQYARRYYNGSVRDMRNLCQTFPNNLLARRLGFEPGAFFEVECATERQPPQVKIGTARL